MKTATNYPKIQSVRPQSGKTLFITFENGDRKIYDCKPLLRTEIFRPLNDDALFRCARADSHGYGVIWNDDIDLAESEIWINGQIAEPDDASDKNSHAATIAMAKREQGEQPERESLD